MKLKPYLEIKDSGIDELGKIPEHWQIKKLKHIISHKGLVRGPFGSNLKIDSFVSDGFKVYEQKNAIYQNLQFGDSYINKEKFLELNRFAVQTNDFLISCSGTIGKFVRIPEKHESGIINQALLIIRYSLDLIDLGFISHVMNSIDFQNTIIDNSQGGVMKNLVGLDTFRQIKIPIPNSKIEQKKIADFLDSKLLKIDSKISKHEKLIELIKEKRQNTINNAVTKGLDSTVPMKDSGLDNIGEIPEHWDIIPFKSLLVQKMDNGIFKKKDQFGAGIRLVNVGDIYEDDGVINQHGLERVIVNKNEFKKYSVMPNDIFFVRSSLKLDGIGVSSIVSNIIEPMVFECHIIRTRPNTQKIHPIYLKNILNCSLIRNHLVSISQTVTMTTISQDHIKNLKIPCPPKLEQKIIADYLDKQLSIMNSLILKIKSQIEKLQEFRQSLISLAVTGKIDLRNYQISA